ncbi:MAG TPA: peptidoglycan-binding protein [Sedimenticola sp.]|nr:peptidoglycan-binding protein [Sedimenticola sp.]
MYAKVTYTPGTSTPLFFRQTEVVGLFDLRQSNPLAIRVAGMQPPAALHGRALVRAVQQALNRLGYDAGPADGLAGSRTRKAIRAFQRTAGVPVDGRPSNTLLRQLRRYTP